MEPYISTGCLPPPDRLRDWVAEAYERFRANTDGEVSDVYPELANVPGDLFGICIVGTTGSTYSAGDVDREFTLMSVSKPFVFALVCEALGADVVRDHIGVNATGLAFNSIAAIERLADGRTNPMVNSGAIATTSLVPGSTLEAKWHFIRDRLSAFAGRDLQINDDVFRSAMASNYRNQRIARMLQVYGRIYMEPSQATELYTRQCALNVSTRDLAVMGGTLADGGVNPLTRQQVIAGDVCHFTLAVMTTAGLYETSGDWLYEIGLPGKSGISGGIVAVSPGKGGLASFAPPVDKAGNSVKGWLVTRFLSQRVGLDLFLSRAERIDSPSTLSRG